MTAIATQARLTLHADLAGDMMVSNPVSIRQDASVNDAILLFTRKGFSVAPVIDAAGRPIGVVSRSDVMIHERPIAQGDNANALVRDLMTPAVFSVSPHTTPATVIQEMLALNVHHVFVVDADGVLIGVIGALDVLRLLQE